MLASADIPGWVAVERLGLPCPVRRPREGVALGAVTWCLSVVRLEGHQGTWEAERFLEMAFGGRLVAQLVERLRDFGSGRAPRLAGSLLSFCPSSRSVPLGSRKSINLFLKMALEVRLFFLAHQAGIKLLSKQKLLVSELGMTR